MKPAYLFTALTAAALLASQSVLARSDAPTNGVDATSLSIGPTSSSQAAVQGMSPERLARIVPVMREQVEKDMFPGAVTLVARNGEVVHFEATGFLDAEKSKPIKKDSIFRLASMTKPIVRRRERRSS